MSSGTYSREVISSSLLQKIDMNKKQPIFHPDFSLVPSEWEEPLNEDKENTVATVQPP